jgi:D-lactate dehydrogenase
MKKGVVFVNTARGGLVDTQALIDALDSGQVSCAALDVVENEFGLYYNDCRDKGLEGHYIDILRNMPNVIYTQHMAFYYRTAVRDMVFNCLRSMKLHSEGKEFPHRLA